ncbi:MAG: hypothetical protein AAF456_11565 [Planctomycetota bacterium]
MSHDSSDLPADETTTGTLTLGEWFTGDFDPQYLFGEPTPDVDWYRIDLEAGRSYQVELTFGNPPVRDFMETQFEAPASSSLSEDRRFGQEVITTLNAGTFFVSAGHAFAAVEGEHFIRVSEYEVPETSDTRITLGGFSSRRNIIATPFDRDAFRLQLVEGWTYQFDQQGLESGQGTLADPNLRLYQDGTGLLASNNNGGRGRDARLAFTAPQTGSYLLSASGIGPATGTYRVVTQILDYLDDAPTGPSTGVQLPLTPNSRSNHIGRLEISRDIDWIKIDLVEGGWYDIGIEAEVEKTFFLRRPDGQIRNIVTGDEGRFYYQAESTGTHHMVVRGRVGDYTLDVVDNVPPTIEAINGQALIVANQTVTLADLFSLDAFPASRIQVFSEADFELNGQTRSAYQLHTLDVGQLGDAEFSALLQEGRFAVSARAIGAGTVSGWAQTTIKSEPGPFQLLDIGRFWNASNTELASDNTVTFRFADSVPGYFEPGRFTGFAPVAESVKSAIRTFLNRRETIGFDLRFQESDSESADIQIFSADATELSVGHAPGSYGFGDIIFDNEFYSGNVEMQSGSIEHFHIIKAIATSLGIKHFSSQLTREESVVGIRPVADPSRPYPETFGYWDIAYLKSRYGNALFANSGPRLGEDNSSFIRTHDGGFSQFGDISATNSDRGAVIDLRDGESSYLLGPGPTQEVILAKNAFANRNTRAFGSEHADQITGSYGGDEIRAAGGNDFIQGLGGNDELSGGTGDDLYFYRTGDGTDTIMETDGGDTLHIQGKFGFDSLEDDLAFYREANDLVIQLDLNGQANRSSGTIVIEEFGTSGNAVETLRLSNFSNEIETFSLMSIWNQTTTERLRFAATSARDQYGLIASPVS